MKSKERQLLEDIAAFIELQLAGRNSIDYPMIVTTIAHDIGGVLRDERCFSPRVSGYADIKEGRK